MFLGKSKQVRNFIQLNLSVCLLWLLEHIFLKCSICSCTVWDRGYQVSYASQKQFEHVMPEHAHLWKQYIYEFVLICLWNPKFATFVFNY